MIKLNELLYHEVIVAVVVLALLVGVTSCRSESNIYGKPIDLKKGQQVTLAQIFAEPGKYEEKNIILEAKTGLICQASGCWVMLTDGTNQLLAQFYTFTVRPPKGSAIRVQGVLKTQNKVPYLATESLEIMR